MLNYAGFVDANCLLYIWPKEMQRSRICLISGDLQKPIFCTFFPQNVVNMDQLDDIIVHSDGSHFTLLKPAVAENSSSFSVRACVLACLSLVVLFCIARIVLYCIVLYCIVLYCIVH